MLTTSFLACSAPRLVAPAMNDRMLADAATQANLETLRERGVTVIEPEEGRLASRGEQGRGRLPDPARLLARLESAMPSGERPWDGMRVLVTAGGTREPVDQVRFLGNRSSGRMGFALAAAAARRGAEVTLIAANVSLPEPAGVRRVDVETAAELAAATAAAFSDSHVLVMAAAPADFRAAEVAEGKLQRSGSLELRLEPTEDILAGLAGSRGEGQTVVGFAAEHGEGGVERARAKLERKGADMIVLNDVSDPTIGFESARERRHPDRPRWGDADSESVEGLDRRLDPRPRRPCSDPESRLQALVRGSGSAGLGLGWLYWVQFFRRQQY